MTGCNDRKWTSYVPLGGLTERESCRPKFDGLHRGPILSLKQSGRIILKQRNGEPTPLAEVPCHVQVLVHVPKAPLSI